MSPSETRLRLVEALLARGCAPAQVPALAAPLEAFIRAAPPAVGAAGHGGPRRDWSPAEDAALRRMLAEGAGSREVAAALDRPMSSIYSRAEKLGLAIGGRVLEIDSIPPAPDPSPEGFGPQGEPSTDAADAGAPAAPPSKSRRRRFKPAEDARLTEMAAAGRSGAEIARALGRGRGAVYNRAKTLGLKLSAGIAGRRPSYHLPTAPLPDADAAAQPGAIAAVVRELRRAGDEVLPVGQGEFLVNGTRLTCDRLIGRHTKIALRRGTKVVHVTNADIAACNRAPPPPGAAEMRARAVKRPRPLPAKPTPAPNAGEAWTPAADDELIALYADGRSNREIAEALGRSQQAIAKRVDALALADPLINRDLMKARYGAVRP